MQTEPLDRYDFLSEVGLISGHKPYLDDIVMDALDRLSDDELQAAVAEAMSSSAYQLKLADVISAHKRLTGQDEETLKIKAHQAFIKIGTDPNDHRDYVFADKRAACAFKLAFGPNGLTVLMNHPLPNGSCDPDEQLFVKTYLAITSVPDSEDGIVRGVNTHQCPQLVFVGDCQICYQTALKAKDSWTNGAWVSAPLNQNKAELEHAGGCLDLRSSK